MPENCNKKWYKNKNWWSSTSSNIVGTVVGIILTFGIGLWVDYKNRQKDKRLATMMITSSILNRFINVRDVYESSYDDLNYLRRLIEIPSSVIEEWPEDSIKEYSYAFSHYTLYKNEIGRQLLRTNMDILRSTDDYYFLFNVENKYNRLEQMEQYYEKNGPAVLYETVTKILSEIAKNENIQNQDYRWELLQINQNPELKRIIKNYCRQFSPMAEQTIETIDDILPEIIEESGYTSEEILEFFKADHEDEED